MQLAWIERAQRWHVSKPPGRVAGAERKLRDGHARQGTAALRLLRARARNLSGHK